jgi:hypothetical protein
MKPAISSGSPVSLNAFLRTQHQPSSFFLTTDVSVHRAEALIGLYAWVILNISDVSHYQIVGSKQPSWSNTEQKTSKFILSVLQDLNPNMMQKHLCKVFPYIVKDTT